MKTIILLPYQIIMFTEFIIVLLLRVPKPEMNQITTVLKTYNVSLPLLHYYMNFIIAVHNFTMLQEQPHPQNRTSTNTIYIRYPYYSSHTIKTKPIVMNHFVPHHFPKVPVANDNCNLDRASVYYYVRAAAFDIMDFKIVGHKLNKTEAAFPLKQYALCILFTYA